MTNPTATATATYAVVRAGHTVDHVLAGYALDGRYSRDEAIAHVEERNATARLARSLFGDRAGKADWEAVYVG